MKVYPIGQVQARPMPGVQVDTKRIQATPDAFGMKQAQDLTALGAAVQKTGQVVLDEQNQAWVRDALNKARAALRDRTDQLLQTRGKDAESVTQQAKDDFGALRRDVSKSLKNPMQQSMFNAAFDQHEFSNLELLRGHETKERERFQIETLDSTMEQALQDALALPAESETRLAEYEQAHAAKLARMGYGGSDPESTTIRKAEQNKATTRFVVQMSEHLAKVDPRKSAAGLDYIQAHADKVDPRAAQVVMERLRQQKDREHIFQVQSDLHNLGLTGEALTQEIMRRVKDKEITPEEAPAIEQTVRHWGAIREQEIAKREELVQEGMAADFVSLFADARVEEDPRVRPEYVEILLINIEARAGREMDPKTKAQLRASAYRVFEARNNATKKAELEREAMDLDSKYRILAAERPEAFATNEVHREILARRPILGDRADHLLAMWDRAAGDRGAKTSPEVKARESAMKDALKIGVDVINAGEEKLKKAGGDPTTIQAMLERKKTAFERQFRSAVQALPKEQQADPVVVKQLANSLLLEVSYDPVGWWSAENREQTLYLFEVLEERAKRGGSGDITIPPATLQALRGVVPPTAKIPASYGVAQTGQFLVEDVDGLEMVRRNNPQPVLDREGKAIPWDQIAWVRINTLGQVQEAARKAPPRPPEPSWWQTLTSPQTTQQPGIYGALGRTVRDLAAQFDPKNGPFTEKQQQDYLSRTRRGK